MKYYLSDSVPDGLAVDPVSNLLYMTDAENDVIEAIDFDSKTKMTIVQLSLFNPRAIIVDPESG